MPTVEIVRSIDAVDPAEWDSLCRPGELFHHHAFVRAVERADVENASHWYVLVRQGPDLVATAALSAFDVSLDLFLGDSWLVRTIRKAFPGVFRVKILFCGLPASFGQNNIAIREGIPPAPVVETIVSAMHRIAREQRIRLLCAKEFAGGSAAGWESFGALGFFRGFSIPYMKMEIAWNGFESYLSSLRHPYRRAIRRSLEKTGGALPRIFRAGEPAPDAQPRLVLGPSSMIPPEDLHRLYTAVMDRTPTRLEVLPQRFFHELFHALGARIELLTFFVGKEPVAVALLVQEDRTLNFLLVGRHDARDETDSYFNLVYGIIELALQRNIRSVNMGQTAYWVKQRVGAVAEDRFIFFKSTRWLLHHVLEALSPIIFPATRLPKVRVFRERARVPLPEAEFA